MNMLLKIVAGLLLAVIALALLATIIFDPNDYKDQIEADLAAVTGGEVEIAGDLRISLLPRPKLELDKVILASAPGFGGAPLAELSRVWLLPRFGPLFSKRIELESVRVQGVRLDLIRDEQGRANWDLLSAPVGEVVPELVGPSAGGPAPSTPQPAEVVQEQSRLDLPAGEVSQTQGSNEPPTAEALAEIGGSVIDAFEATDVNVTFDDRQTGWGFALVNAEVSAGPLAIAQPLSLRLTGLMIRGQGGAPMELQAEAIVHAGEAPTALRLDPLKVRLDDVVIVDGLAADLELQARLETDLRARRYLADDLRLQIDASGTALSGGRIDAAAGARIELDLGTETLRVEDLSIHSGSLEIRGAAVGQRLLSAPLLEGSWTLDELDLRAWLQNRSLPALRGVGAETFRRVALSTGWRAKDGRLALRDLDLEIDQTRIEGSLQRTSSIPAGYSFDLQADGLDVDRYLPPVDPARLQAKPTRDPQNSDAGPAKPTTQSAATSEPLSAPASTPIESPSGPDPAPSLSLQGQTAIPDLDGRVRVGKLKLARLRFGSADLRIRAKDGILDLNTKSEHFYQGRLNGRVGLDLRGAEPVISLTQQAQGVQAGPLLTDLTGDDRVTGRGGITTDLTARGLSPEALRDSLSGNLAVQLTDGAVKGFNLARLIADARASVTGGRAAADLPTRTDFTDARASATIQNGILDNRDLTVTADQLQVTGAGTIDLGREWFDYRFEPLVVQAPQDQGLDGLEGISVPVHLTGTFARPQWNVDVVSALQAVAERELKGQGGFFKKLEESTGIKGLEQGLRGLFGR